MTVTRRIQMSWAGGEITPELFGRLDLDKYQSALAECNNFIPMAHGSLRTRPGTSYVISTRTQSDPVRMIPFQWSNEQTMALEFGHEYVRFHTDGSTVLSAGIACTNVDTGGGTALTVAAHGLITGDVVWLSGFGGDFTFMNDRYWRVLVSDANTFAITNHDGSHVDSTGMTGTPGEALAPYTVATPYAAADLFSLNYVQDSDVLTITSNLYRPRELRRYGATDWRLEPITFEPSIAPPKGDRKSPATISAVSTPTLYNDAPYGISKGGTGATNTMYNAYKVTSVSKDEEESAPVSVWMDLDPAWDNRINKITVRAGYLEIEFDGSRTLSPDLKGLGENWSVSFSGIPLTGTPSAAQDIIANALNGTEAETTKPDGASAWTATMVQVNIDLSDQLAVTTAVTFADNNDNQPARMWVHTAPINLGISGSKNTIKWTAVDGAKRYKIYKTTATGGVYGYIGTTEATSFVDDNKIPDTTRAISTIADAFDTAGDYPRSCTYYEQRRVFGGTDNAKQTIWMTQTGTQSNLLASVPAKTTDAIRFKMAARDHNSILHLVPLNDLLVLTSAGEWRAFAPSGDPISMETLVVRPQSFTGSSTVTPALTAGSVIYVQFGDQTLRELSYSWESESYKSRDITAMSPHLFEGRKVTSMAFQRTPVPILWCVMDDGILISCTYMPEHKVVSFATHDTDGEFESVCVIVEDNEDVPYFTVKRDGVRLVERMASIRTMETLAESMRVDCGLTYDGTPVSSLSGLWHLEGKTVSILTDGAVHPQRVVTNGAVTLDYPASIVHVGLPFTARAVTLPMSFDVEDGGFGILKNINKVWLKLRTTLGLKVGVDDDYLIDMTRRTSEPMGTPPTPVTGMIEIPFLGDWSYDGQLIMVQDEPLPATILAAAYEVAIDAGS